MDSIDIESQKAYLQYLYGEMAAVEATISSLCQSALGGYYYKYGTQIKAEGRRLRTLKLEADKAFSKLMRSTI